jgi:hypothetical protein
MTKETQRKGGQKRGADADYLEVGADKAVSDAGNRFDLKRRKSKIKPTVTRKEKKVEKTCSAVSECGECLSNRDKISRRPSSLGIPGERRRKGETRRGRIGYIEKERTANGGVIFKTQTDFHFSIESSRPSQRAVQRSRAVRRSDDDDLAVGLNTVQQSQQGRDDSPLCFVLYFFSFRCDGVELVDEDDRGSLGLSLFKDTTQLKEQKEEE